MKTHQFTSPSTGLTLSARSLGDGPTILFLHGFPDNELTFDKQLKAVAKAGYRGMSLTMRGYEASSQPANNNYDLLSMAEDVASIISELGEDKVHLVGHDWGAAIAYRTASLAPQNIHSLTALALPHPGRFINEMILYPKQIKLSWYIFFFQLGFVAKAKIKRNNFQFIRSLWENWSPNWTAPNAHIEKVLETFQQPGVLSSALQYYQQVLTLKAFTPSTRKEALFKVAVPTLAISGGQDGCIDSQTFEKMMHTEDFPQGLRFERIDHAGHFPHLEHAELTNELIINWVNEHSSTKPS